MESSDTAELQGRKDDMSQPTTAQNPVASQRSRLDKVRDRIAYRLVRLVMRIASPRYRAFCQGAWVYGLNAAVRDERLGVGPPPSWADDWDSPEDSVYDH